MKTKLFAAVAGLALIVAGCVGTVGGHSKAGVPFVKDTIKSSYERPAADVFQATQDVVAHNGVVLSTSTLYGRTNAVDGIAKVVEGKVNQRSVWVRIEQVNPKFTEVATQVRSQSGGTDLELAAEIDKQIALKLVR
jgi:PBP1b-binding outer membrane lipoprotein LpoB